MTETTLLAFSLRHHNSAYLEEIVSRVTRALDVPLVRVYNHPIGAYPIYEGRALGLVITLFEYPPRQSREIATFQLHGSPDVEYVLNQEIGSIDDYVIHLLDKKAAGEWHAPSDTEIDAEIRFEPNDD